MNDEAVCRTAPATPGLSIIIKMTNVTMILSWSFWSSNGDAMGWVTTFFYFLLSMHKHYFFFNPTYGRYWLYRLVWKIAPMHKGWKHLTSDQMLLKVNNSHQRCSKRLKATKSKQMWLKVTLSDITGKYVIFGANVPVLTMANVLRANEQ